MKETILPPKPVQIGNYSKVTPQIPKVDKSKVHDTNGRKILALWSN